MVVAALTFAQRFGGLLGTFRRAFFGPLLVPALAAIVGASFGWIGTGPGVSLGINWDTAAYVSDLASGRQGPGATPWSSHVALGPLYACGMALVRPFGGTPLDGVRLLGALALAASAALVAAMAGRATGSRVRAGLAALAFLAWWDTWRLVLSWEDNVLALPFGLAALALTLEHAERWPLRASLLAGLCLGAGTLVSWQGALWFGPVAYGIALAGTQPRSLLRRLRDVTAVGVSLCLARVMWALGCAALGAQDSAGRLLGIAFARPEPSFFPASLGEFLGLLARGRTVLRHVGFGVLQATLDLGPDDARMRSLVLAVGAGALICSLALAIHSGQRRGESQQALQRHLVAAGLLFCFLGAALYVDLPADKYKRYDFLAPLAALVLANGRRARLGPILLGAVILLGTSHAVVRVRAAHAALALREPDGYHGRGGETWFTHFRRLHRASPQACGFVFAFDELAHARYQLEIQAALWSELPAPRVLGEPSLVAGWPRPLPVVRPSASTPRPCEVVSAAAQRLLAGQ